MATPGSRISRPLGSEHRYNFNRRLKQATKNFQFRFEQARSPEECHEALDRLIALHNMRWRGSRRLGRV